MAPRSTLRRQKLRAKGFFSKLKRGASEVVRRGKLILSGPRNTSSKRFEDFLTANGNEGIESISIGRQPVEKGIQRAVNALTFGKFNKIKKQLDYDDVYHNYMIVRLKSGKSYRVEKNHVVEAKAVDPSTKGEYDIPVREGQLNLNHLIHNASAGDPNFWSYDPKSSNCQVFVKELVTRNNLAKALPAAAEVILKPQNAEKLITGPLKAIPKAITDLAGSFDRIDGKGIHYSKRPYRKH